ncbi:MAG TPA: hypothetical protein VH298_03825 [Jatrophihabitans sp.]|nr:hypothetical protein [Jatrophihabitans sp.]
MVTAQENVFVLWCRLTGNDPTDFGDDEREAFLARPQVQQLAWTAYPILLDAGISVARRGSLPLEHWLRATEVEHQVGA